MLRSMGLQRVGHTWATEEQQYFNVYFNFGQILPNCFLKSSIVIFTAASNVRESFS